MMQRFNTLTPLWHNVKRVASTSLAVVVAMATTAACAAEDPNSPALLQLPAGLGSPEQWTSPEGLSSALQVMLLLTVISLAPALLMMTTCFVRILVVLGLLRQALGTQQLPPNQVVTSLAVFITLSVLATARTQAHEDAG